METVPVVVALVVAVVVVVVVSVVSVVTDGVGVVPVGKFVGGGGRTPFTQSTK